MRGFAIFALSLALLMPLTARADEMIYREDAGLTKAEYFLATGKFSAALDTANDVIARRPTSADAWTYKGYALSRLGQKKAAAESFLQALKLNPTHLGANKYLADIYVEDGDIARALEYMSVIRMACQNGDCPELRALQFEVDRQKSGQSRTDTPKGDKKDAKKPE